MMPAGYFELPDDDLAERAHAAAIAFAARTPPPTSKEDFTRWCRRCVSAVMRQTEPGAVSTSLN